MESAIKAEVWGTIETLNRIWTTGGDCARLSDFFHPDMLALTASDRLRLEGRAACLQAWRHFAETAIIHDFQANDPAIRLFAGQRAAVVSYYYNLDCTIQGKRLHLTGRDLFTLVHEEGKWRVMADHFSPYP